MIPKAPVLDIFIGRRGDAWRLDVAPSSWKPGLLWIRMDGHGEIFPVARPDVDDLDRFMWDVDSPFAKGQLFRDAEVEHFDDRDAAHALGQEKIRRPISPAPFCFGHRR